MSLFLEWKQLQTHVGHMKQQQNILTYQSRVDRKPAESTSYSQHTFEREHCFMIPASLNSTTYCMSLGLL